MSLPSSARDEGASLAGPRLAVTGDMQRKEQLILKHALQSIAVAVTIVFLGHFLFGLWPKAS